MKAQALLPADEDERMAAVRRYDVLDTPPDGAFDRIAAMAARLFDVPIAIVSVVDTDRIWFKSHHGLPDVTEIAREPGLCASAILGTGAHVVSDAAQDPRTLANPLVAGEFGLRFYAGVPLTTHDGFNLGTLCVIDHEPRVVTLEETAWLADLAALVMDELELRLAARRAVEEAQLRLGEVQGLAQALQASLLPPALTPIPWLDVVARCRPASRFEVGGDFYDVFPLDDRSWGFVIGDVRGKGPHAAARTSFARYSLRAAAIQEADPSKVLALVNTALVNDIASEVEPPFVTVLYARVLPGPGGAHVSFASAGHPLPTHVSADGSVAEVGEPGTLLGVLPELSVTTSQVMLRPDESLLLITDGVLDSGSPERLGQDGYEALVRAHAPSMPAVVEAVHTEVMRAQRDDMALLAITASSSGPASG
jgi:sigma-B regulation protein RsbU (phosphoserine phosphatase)